MGTEFVQFVGALVLFLGILIGSYWFVYVPGASRRAPRQDDRGSRTGSRTGARTGSGE